MRGSCTTARAIDTRCCNPRLSGTARGRLPGQRRPAARATLWPWHAACRTRKGGRRNSTFSRAVSAG